MHRLTVPLSLLALLGLMSACKREAAAPDVATQVEAASKPAQAEVSAEEPREEEEEAADEEEAHGAAPAGEESEPPELVVTPATVEAYVKFSREYLPALRKRLLHLEEASDELREQGTASGVRAALSWTRWMAEMEELERAGLEKHGLSRDQRDAIYRIGMGLIRQEEAAPHQPEVEKQLEEARARLAKLPADAQAEAVEAVKEAERQLLRITSLEEFSLLYGAAAVEAVVARRQEVIETVREKSRVLAEVQARSDARR